MDDAIDSPRDAHPPDGPRVTRRKRRLRAARAQRTGRAKRARPRLKPTKRIVAPRAPVTAPAPEPPRVDPVTRADARDAEKRLRDEHARLVEMLREERTRNAFLERLGKPQPTPRIVRTEKTSGLRDVTAMAAGSDWHVEEPVDPEKVEGRNEYNLVIADQRITRFFDAIIYLVEHHRASRRFLINNVIVGLLGDLMTGHIHDELVESAELSPIETALWLKPRILVGLRRVADKLNVHSITVPCCRGNHGRVGQAKKISTGAENSYEYLLFKMLEAELRDDTRFSFVATKSEHQFVDIYDFTMGFSHGDQIGYAGGVGGIGIPILKALPQFDQARYADWRVFGHFHTFRDFGRAIVNGSLIGYAPYGYHIRAPFEPPQQAFCLIDSKRGKNNVTPLWVDGEDMAGKRVRTR